MRNQTNGTNRRDNTSSAKILTIYIVIYAIFVQTFFLPLPGNAAVTNLLTPPQIIVPAVITQHRPTLNSGIIDGSLRLQNGENFSINSGVAMSEVFLPGTPSFTFNQGTHGEIISDNGAAVPTGYRMTMNGGQITGNIHTQSDPVAFPADIPVSVPNSAGTRTVNINSPADTANIGNWQTVANLIVNPNNLTIDVPPGNYQSITLNGNSKIRFSSGTYNFSNTITINNNSRIESSGAVNINVRQALNLNTGKFTLGANTSAADVRLNILGATVRVNSNCEINASVRIPNGILTMNSSSARVRGTVWANYFILNGGTITGETCATDGSGCAAVPVLESVSPNQRLQGQTVQVNLTGVNTNWSPGQTRVSFGGEISVGGSPEGEAGLVNVLSATSATADLVINGKAALAPRTVRVVTQLSNGQTEQVLLNDAFAVLPTSAPGSSQNGVATIAGSPGQTGAADGTGVQARFNDLAGITVGADDAVYIADAGNNRVRVARQQTSGGWTVQTLAGSGAGFQDGVGSQAKFNNPQGIAVVVDGSLYVADAGNNRIRRILPDGTVSTIAGDGAAGFQDGIGAAAKFNNPRGIAVDNAGNIYVADTGNSAVRRIDAGGSVATVAGDGSIGANDSPNARFNGLAGITVDGDNVYIYIADGANHLIRRLDSTGTVMTLAGESRGFADGSANEARFANPTGLAVDGAGRIIIADTVNSLIRSVAPNLATSGSPLAVSTLAGAGEYGATDGAGNVAKFKLPRGVAVARSGAVFVADTGNNVLRRIGIPPRILSFTPTTGKVADTITIYGENFDARANDKNTVSFAKSGGGTINASVVSASQTQLSVVVPAEAATGRITVATQDGTATSEGDFTVEENPSPVITDFAPRRGQVGTAVKIVGTDLKNANANPLVTFRSSNNGRLNALVNSATATEVNVLVPNGAVTGFIELATGWGSAQTPQEFVVDETQQFQITVAPSTIQAVDKTTGTAIVSLISGNATFTQLAKLSVAGLPNGITAAFDPENITAGATATLKLNLQNSTASVGSYPLVVKASAMIDGREVIKETTASLSILAAGQTTLSGRVLNTDSEPVIGATVSLDGRTTTTDASGSFTLAGITAGQSRPLQIDGRTASAPNRTYPVITEPANIIAGRANQVPYIFYLPAIDTQNEVVIVPGQTTIVTTPKVSGVSVTIPANANLRNRDGSPVTRVSITALPIDRTPTPLPGDVRAGIVFTIQPGGAISDVPMPITFPNTLGAMPGTQIPLYAFDHDNVRWYIYGYGQVSQDGKIIEPKINPETGLPYGITNFSWFLGANPGDGNPGGGPGGNGANSGDCSEGSRGNNPVDLSTGMKIEPSLDIAFEGSRGGLALGRTYTSQLGARSIPGSFGIGTKSSYDFQMTLTVGVDTGGRETGFGFLITPEDSQGRIFSYAGRDTSNNRYFKSGNIMQFQGDVLVQLSSGIVDYRRSDGSTLHFESDGQTTNGYRLSSVSDRNDNAITLNYSGNKISRLTDAVGRSITFNYGSNGFISSATDPKNRTWIYSYDSSERLNRVTDPLGRAIRYEYGTRNLLTAVFDSQDIKVKEINYDGFPRVIQQNFPDGGLETYSYETAGATVVKTKIVSPQGRTITKRFNGNGYVIETVDPLGQKGTIERDSRNFAVRSTGACGCTDSTKTFDDRGNPTTITDRQGNSVDVQYEPRFNNVIAVTDKLRRLTAMTYDVNGNLKTVTDPVGNTVQNFYNSVGQLIEVKDSVGKSTKFEYDDYGNISSMIDKSDARWTYEYDILGNLITSSDPLGRTSRYIYDNANRLLSTTDPNGATTTFAYDVNANITKITDQLGRVWRRKYDVSNRLIESTDPLNQKLTRTYGVDGDLLSVTSPTGRITKHKYDARGQILQTTDPENKTAKFTYDYRGNMISLEDERGYSTSFVYDELNRLTYSRNPLGETSTLEYNRAGKVIKATDALGKITAIDYDDLDRTKTVNYPDAQVGFTYDSLSRVTQIDDSQGGSIQWNYDDRDLVLSETTATGTVSYNYNSAGQRQSMNVPGSLPVNYNYDSAGRLQKIVQGTEEYSYNYDILSRMTGMSRPNGVSTSYTYDAINRLKRMSHTNSSGQFVEDYQFGYNPDDEITAITSLNSANLSPQTKTASPPDEANRSTQFGDANYTFDARGQNVSTNDSQGITQYNWDDRGRLTEAVLPNGNTVSYQYDAIGRRKSRTSGGNTTEFVYDGEDVVQDRLPGNDQIDYLNGFGIDNKLRMSSTSTGSLYYLQDQIGSTQGLTDATGSVVEWQRYTPYGESNLTNPISRFGYTGREFDAETKMIFYRARWYDPARGSFISQDPKGLAAGNNLYEYTGGNPISRRDPFGLDYFDYLPFSEAAKERGRRIEMAILSRAAQFAAGFGDTASLGATRYVRQWMGIDDVVDYCSGWYSAGGWTATAIEVIEGGYGIYKAVGRSAVKKALKEGVEEFGDDAARAVKNCVMCFEAGTEVETAGGQIPIEEIKEGDQVLSYSEQTGRNEYRQVTQTFSRLADDVLELRVEGEIKPIGVTSEHPFFVKRKSNRTARSDTSGEGDDADGKWLETIQLQAGDYIRTSNGRWARVLSIRPKGEARVYNFTVEKNHNYFVGDLRLLTHNAGCWTATKSKSSVENAFSHWKDHKGEFSELNNAKEYAEAAKDFVSSPPSGALTKVRPNGDKLVYDAATNTFGVNRGGVPATMFRPTDGMKYWLKQ